MGALDILLAILGISFLVIVHESGHYVVARVFKMRVLRYSIGFGPALLRHRPKGSPTTFQICAIPFLAYVQIAGMNPHDDADPDDPGTFTNKGIFARICTIAAGPAANYLAASLLVFVLALTGWPDSETIEPMTVGVVEGGSPASQAGIEVDDVVVEANGVAIANVQDLIDVTSPRAGQETRYVVQRHGHRLAPMTIIPKETDGRGIIGVRAKAKRIYTPMGVSDAAKRAVVYPVQFTLMQVAGITGMIRQGTMDDLRGPLGMGKIVAEQVQQGPAEFALILVLLSVALGFFNLLPFPALDGGRLAFLVYELVTRRRPNERFEAVVHTVGILILLGVLALVTFREIIG